MSDIVLRPGRPDDLVGLLEIRNDAIAHSTAIWSDAPIDEAAGAEWLAGLINADALIVAHDRDAAGPDAVAGYAAYFGYRAKEGYRATVENSVYLRAEHQGRGLGRALLTAIVDRATAAGMHVMIAAIESSNEASIRLHETCGFTPAGRLDQVGQKFGRWLDLTLLLRRLDDAQPSSSQTP